jgi:DNA-binding IclR family transcriptional regulator
VQKACRILRSLTEPRVSRLSEVAKTYSLGTEVGILAAAMRDRDDLRSRARPSLVRMAAVSEDSVLLSVRSGSESVCVDREVGSFPIRANYLDIGSRRPLGVGAGAMALLAWQSDAEIEALLPIIEARLAQFPKVSRKWIEDEISKSRERGYTLLLNVLVDRMGAVGVPVIGPEGKPIAALAIAALSDRITSRLDMMVEMLKREAENVAESRRG